ncbi:MAG: hypothetical protein ACJ786_12670, partial [Catenulispora sp.]
TLATLGASAQIDADPHHVQPQAQRYGHTDSRADHRPSTSMKTAITVGSRRKEFLLGPLRLPTRPKSSTSPQRHFQVPMPRLLQRVARLVTRRALRGVARADGHGCRIGYFPGEQGRGGCTRREGSSRE